MPPERSREWFDQSSPLNELLNLLSLNFARVFPQTPVTMAATQHLNLAPFLAEAGKFDKLVESGQTLSAAISPLDDSIAAYLKSTVCGNVSRTAGKAFD